MEQQINPTQIISSRYVTKVEGGQVELPKQILDTLNKFLESDPCTRWNTRRDGEEIVELILLVTAYARSYSIPFEVIAQDFFKVSMYTTVCKCHAQHEFFWAVYFSSTFHPLKSMVWMGFLLFKPNHFFHTPTTQSQHVMAHNLH